MSDDYHTRAAVDAYLVDAFVGDDAPLNDALGRQREAQLPDIEVSPTAGKLLHLIARAIGAKRVLEIGTLGGYSTIWLARAVGEGGRVVTLEYEPSHAAVARESINAAGVGERVEICVGPAAATLEALQPGEQFDLCFIDADKQNNTVYLDQAARLCRPGGVVIVDNVVRAGRVVTTGPDDDQAEGVRRGLRMLRDDPRFDATAIQTFDRKGWDGFAFAIVTDAAAPGEP